MIRFGSDEIPIGALVPIFLIVGVWSLSKTVCSRSMPAERFIFVAFLPSALPSMLLFVLGDSNQARDNGILNFALWESCALLCWLLLWIIIIVRRIELSNFDRVVQKPTKHGLKLAVGILIVGASAVGLSLLLFTFGSTVMFNSNCAKLKCELAANLLGSRQTVHGPILISTTINCLFLAAVSLRLAYAIAARPKMPI